ncbi:hypothetical protein SEA_ZION_70 [Corynebacterium phage Zion]|uniref:Uncharacterized protein n=6 Tax=Ceetrepovirus TaxID=2560111 RepID=A0A3G3LWK1_9CAUD|nr:hypothetical protein FDJ10_gp73 [Corynebacterium phage C3PO]YP_009620411.1 hypothetical protein FDJ12_gp74 [Corynebacterium phage Zion]YP_010099049.1 hypothetical protein KNU16_gp73 [Corynebacterium phage Kimchi1738]ATW58662.1 hypothetical protein SEA_POTATOCHIP_70 [Corynebacterium phage PotatoChip]AYQ98366.1 hypothetical protein CRUELLA_70 [Corynebacterium phage Cruella]AYR03338.1 hypothetical protein PETEYPAB_69 [Corynebacterium phage PeteyPab]ATW58531.1 hypothetical protein SEA_C3PO_70 
MSQYEIISIATRLQESLKDEEND